MEQSFDRPIPGMGMTFEVGSRPWQTPPELTTVEQATDYYVERMNTDAFKGQLIDVIEMGVPLATLANTIQLASVMEGIHSIDVSLIVHPVLVEYVHVQAKEAGIKNIVLKARNKKEDMAKKEKQLLVSRLQRAIDKMETEDAGTDILEQTQAFLQENREEQPVEAEEEAEVEEKPVGLMARRGE